MINNNGISVHAGAAIELLKREGRNCAVSVGMLLDELGDKEPATAVDLLDMIHALIDDPRIDQVPDDVTISFAWNGKEVDA